MIKKLFGLFLAMLLSLEITAQSAEQRVFASGGQAIGLLSYTIGEPLTNTLETSSSTLTQGFQQVRLIINDVKHISSNIFINVYPNPTATDLNVSIAGYDKPLNFFICDIQGKILSEHLESVKAITIPVVGLSQGIYILITKTKDNETVSQHKFIKF